ncbi:hypothetical protein LCGC14_2233430, partial [marine sediment metagenome]
QLNDDQVRWHAKWEGRVVVVRTTADAFQAVGFSRGAEMNDVADFLGWLKHFLILVIAMEQKKSKSWMWIRKGVSAMADDTEEFIEALDTAKVRDATRIVERMDHEELLDAREVVEAADEKIGNLITPESEAWWRNARALMRELLAALDEGDAAQEVPEPLSVVDNDGLPTEKAVMRRHIKRARDVVEAARHVVVEMPDGGYRIIVEDFNLRRLEELDEALKRYDEGVKG